MRASTTWLITSLLGTLDNKAQPQLATTKDSIDVPRQAVGQDFGFGKVGNSRVGQAEVNLDRAVPGQGLMRADGVVSPG
jgi:hypothetical protein